MGQKQQNASITNNIQHPWVVVTDAGTDHERIYNDYPSFSCAHIGLKELNYQTGSSDIMKRQEDGTLTTEF